MKIIKINESQANNIFTENYDGFSLSVFDSIQDYESRLEYCKSKLGKPIGDGLGRIVFEIGDDEVIKIAKRPTFSSEGMEQNKNEVKIYKTLGKKYKIFTKVFQHAKDFSWIVSEKVLQFHPQDSLQLLGIPFSNKEYEISTMNRIMGKNGVNYSTNYDGYEKAQEYHGKYDVKPSLSGFIDWCSDYAMNCYCGDFDSDMIDDEKDETYYDLLNKSEWCREFYKFMLETRGDSDIYFENMGLALRDGKPYLVILDSGCEQLK